MFFSSIFVNSSSSISTKELGEIEFSPIAEDILSVMSNQFIELSQSGTGLHIITRGTVDKNFKNSETGVEIYKDKRFVAMTGKALCENEPTINQDGLDYVFNKYKTIKKAQNKQNKAVSKSSCNLTMDDKKIVYKASEKGKKFKFLYEGDWSSAGYKSQSEADSGLCLILAFWTNCNKEAMDRIFRTSGLYREKWEREDYRNETLSVACDYCEETLNEYVDRMKREEAEALEKEFLSVW